jgi:hypothetical protein
MSDPESKSYEEVQNAQALLDGAGLSHWSVTPVHGVSGDPLAYFKATRVAPGGIREVTHREARVLLDLCREAELRFDTAPQSAVTVTSGPIDTHNHGG